MERYLGGWSRRKGRNKGVDNRQPGVTLGDGTERKLSDYDSKKGVPLLLSVKSWIENAPVRRATIAQPVAEISFSHDRIISPYSSRFLIVFFFFLFFLKKEVEIFAKMLKEISVFHGENILFYIPRARQEKKRIKRRLNFIEIWIIIDFF